ncbi:MAG TPA: hypothetical protein DEZ08_06635 [Dehalococcoidia bacterium]|jgi:membrane protease YdiL (CAAX protease family)|nr:hypothetical protein [Dehalococcoidia bacterium]|tara:strand:+ start:607 stop:1308 length:702 start_codon:yes stop_codon:yes gene_type:complete
MSEVVGQVKHGLVASMALAAIGTLLILLTDYFGNKLFAGQINLAAITVISSMFMGVIVVSIIYLFEGRSFFKFIYFKFAMPPKLHIVKIGSIILGGVFLSIGGSTGLVIVAGFLELHVLIPEINYSSLIFKWPFLILSVISLVLVVPVFEEIFFRTYLITCFKRLGMWQSIILAAFIFGLFHGGQFEIIVVASTFFTGIILGYIYCKLNTILPCIIIHGVQNSLVIITTMITV